MSAVGQIQMHAALSRVNSDTVQSGLKSDRSAAPTGFDAFLAALDQSKSSQQQVFARKSDVQSDPQMRFGMQNLPKKQSQFANSADITQSLIGQIAAQGMLTQALSESNQGGVEQNPLNINSAADIQGLMYSINAAQADPGSKINASQNALMTQAISRAIQTSGQAADPNSQGVAVQLLQALQGAKTESRLTDNPAFNQALKLSQDQFAGQSPAQIASAVQALAEKNQVTLPLEMQARLNELVNQGSSGGIKLISVQNAESSATTVEAAKISKLPALAVDSTQKILDVAPQFGATKAKGGGVNAGTLGADGKSAVGKMMSNQIKNLDDFSTKDALANGSSLEANSASNTLQAGLAPLDNPAISQNRIEIKQSEISLTRGPLHAEIMNSAKLGGGRIVLELTPPEQGTIRIDLHISQTGQAHLIVEGAGDATKARLDQGGQNLKNEFAQMGLNLSLDLRQGNQWQQARDQAFGGQQQTPNASANFAARGGPNSLMALSSIGSGDNRANSSTVHLYA